MRALFLLPALLGLLAALAGGLAPLVAQTAPAKGGANTPPSSGGGGATPASIPNGGDTSPPIVTFTPDGQTTSSGTLPVTVGWCDDANLVSGSRVITLDGQALASDYGPDTQSGCVRYAVSHVTLTLGGGAAHTLTASISDGTNRGSNSAQYTYNTDTYTSQGLTATLVSPKLYRDPALCALDCGELVTSYSTMAYRSRDVARSATLVYRSGRAHPMPVIEVDVVDSTPGFTPSWLMLHLLDANGTQVPVTNGAPNCPSPSSPCPQQVVRQYQPGVPNRLAAQFDAAGLGTGAYRYTAVVTAYNQNAVEVLHVSVPVRVLVDGVYGAQSFYGAGWGIAGLQRYSWQADGSGLVIVDGDGTMGFWATGSTAGSVTSYVSPPGDVSTVSWDASTTTLTRRTPDGMVARFDGTGAINSVTDRLGNVTVFGYTDGSETKIGAIADPSGHQIGFGYWPPGYGWRQGALSIYFDGNGRTVAFGVDSANDLRVVNEPQGTDNTSARLETHHYAYTAHRLTQNQDARGATWSYGFDALGGLASLTSPPAVGAAGTTQMTTSTTSWLAAVLPAPGTGSWYNAGPLPALPNSTPRAVVTSPDGLTTRTRLDGWGAPTQVEGSAGDTTWAARDGNGQVTQVVNARHQVTSLVWDPAWPFLLDSTYDAAAKLGTAYTYDAANYYGLRQTRVNGNQAELRTYSGGRLASVQAGDATGPVTRYAYTRAWDPRPDTVVDAGNHKTAYAYEASGLQNVQAATSPAGTTTVAHDVYGRNSVATDPLGHQTRTTYDVQNRPTTVTDPNGHATTTGYDALYAHTVTDAANQQYRDSVSALGVPFFSYDPGGQQTATTYDAAGRMATWTNRRGQVLNYAYDPTLGTLVSRTVADTSAANSNNAWYGTDALGRVRWGRTGESTDSVFTDALGRDSVTVHVITPAGGGSVAYVLAARYDSLGRRTSVALAQRGGPAAGTARYHYNARNQLDTLWDASGAATTFSYSVEGALTGTLLPGTGSRTTPPTSLHRANGIRFPGNWNLDQAFGHQFVFDTLGRVQSRLTVANGLAAGTGYGYDAAGQLDSVYRVTYSSAPDSTCTPLYGAGGTGLAPSSSGEQPTGYNCPPGTVNRGVNNVTTYAWDPVGNPVRPDVYILPATGNRMAWANGQNLGYDADGNMWGRLVNQAVVQYLTWNSLNQLVTVAPNAGSSPTVTFGYDAWGRRVRKTNISTGVTTYYVWDGDNLAATLQGTTLARYTQYPGTVDRPHSVTVGAVSQGGATYYYVQDDAPGNVLGLVTAGGQVAATYQYDVWGQTTAVSETGLGSWSNPHRFAGREYDAETGLYSNRARYYDPTLGRFVSADPTSLGGGINWYAYAGNDPVNRKDPSGECPLDALQFEIDTDTGKWTMTCNDGSGETGTGSLGVAHLDPINVTGHQNPFSTPPSVGATPNFGDPTKRGGSLFGPVSFPGGGGGYTFGFESIQPELKNVPTHDPKYDACTAKVPGMGVASALSLVPVFANLKYPGDLTMEGSSMWTTIDRRLPAWTGAEVNAGLPVRVVGTVGRVKYLGRLGTATWIIGAAGFVYGAGGRAYCLQQTYGSSGS